MRRIYFEYLAGLTLIFLISIYSYAFLVYQVGTDYEYILRDHQAQASQELINIIASEKGIDEAEAILEDYANKTRQLLRIVDHKDAPEMVQKRLPIEKYTLITMRKTFFGCVYREVKAYMNYRMIKSRSSERR